MFGAILKTFRELRQLTQSELADKLFLSGPMSISNYEKNKRLPSISMLRDMSRILDFRMVIDNGEIVFTDKIIKEKGSVLMEANIVETVKKEIENLISKSNIKDIGDMNEVIINFIESKYNNQVTWRGFEPQSYDSDIENYETADDIRLYLLNNIEKLYCWEYDIEIDGEYFVIYLSFNIKNNTNLISVINNMFAGYGAGEEFDFDTDFQYRDITLGYPELLNNEISDIKICNL